jgi:hypothetical protein
MGMRDFVRQTRADVEAYQRTLSSYDGSQGPYPGGAGIGSSTLRRLSQYFIWPELERTRELGAPVEEAFQSQMLTPGANFSAASTAASGMASELFAPGGEIATMLGKARGKAIGQGFAPSGAEGAERGILRAGTQRVADAFAQQAASLESQRMGLVGGAYGDAQAGQRDLIESMFTAEGSAQQLAIAKQAAKRGPFGLW